MLLASIRFDFMKIAPKDFVSMMFLLIFLLILRFSFTRLFLFYMAFEFTIIPTFLLILGWGYRVERFQAGMYIFMYTLVASLPFLLLLFSLNLYEGRLNYFYLFYFGGKAIGRI